MSNDTESKSLSDLIDGTGEASQPEQAHVAPEPREIEPEPKDTGAKLEASEPPSGAEDSDDSSPTVPRKALLDERKKRQEYERKLAEFEAKLAQFDKAQQPPPQQPMQQQGPPDPWVDPEGALAWERQQREVQLYETRVLMSEELMSREPGYEDAKRVFLAAAQADPTLAHKLVHHPLPAKYVYEEGRRLQALQEIGPDPSTYRQRLEAEIREQIMAEMQGNNAPVQPRAPAPKSLAGTTNAMPRDKSGRFAGNNGPTPLEDIIG